MPPSPSLRCGTAGWAYSHWNGVVYPRPRPRGFHPLEFLAGWFDAVEINTSFYYNLRPEIVRLWIGKVSHNPNFGFALKLHRRFTHDRVFDAADVAAFKDGLWPLLHSGRLGCVLMQFPASFRFTPENREHFIRLRRAFHEFPLVAEMRHSSWMRDEALGTFIDYRVGFCNIDQPQALRAMPPTAFLTSSIAYVRLHGRRAGTWQEEFGERAMRPRSVDYLYTAAELEEWKLRIDRISGLASETFVITNNDAGGKACVNALQLQSLLGKPGRQAPADLVRTFPAALADFRSDRPVQDSLFHSSGGNDDSTSRGVIGQGWPAQAPSRPARGADRAA